MDFVMADWYRIGINRVSTILQIVSHLRVGAEL